MKTRWNGRRFLAALLAFVLTFTSLGLDGISAYADEPGPVNTLKLYLHENCEIANGKVEVKIDDNETVEMSKGEENGVDVLGAESIYLKITPNEGYEVDINNATVRVDGAQTPDPLSNYYVESGLDFGNYDLSGFTDKRIEIENIRFRNPSGDPGNQPGGQPNNEVVIYKDAECTEPYAQNGKAFTGDTVYAKVREGSEEGFEIIGWAKGNEFSWPQDSDPEGCNTDSKDGFTYSYEDGVASLTIPSDYYNDDILFIGMISHGEGNDEYHDSRLWVNQSLKGLVLCDDGDPYLNGNGDGGFNFIWDGFPQYKKDSGACVYDTKCFALAISGEDELWVDNDKINGITALDATSGFTLERFNGTSFESYEGQFGYRGEHLTPDEYDSGAYYAHYYLQVYDEGTYRLSYNGEGIDENHNYVLFNVGLPRIALFYDENAEMFFAGEQIFFNEGNTEATYYLHLDADRELGFVNLGVTIWENGDEKNYSYAGNGTFKEGENSADLSKYFIFEETADDFTFKVTFREGDYDLDFSADFLYHDGDNTDPRRDPDGRHYYARTSMAGKLGMLDWLEEVWDEYGNLNYDIMYTGSDAHYDIEKSWEMQDGPRYFILGIIKDMFGESADMVEAADIKVYRENGGEWEDVTDILDAGFAGDASSENPVARGLYKVNTSEIGEYKLVVTKEDKDYEFFYNVILPYVALYTDDSTFDSSTVCLTHDIMNNGTTPYYLHINVEDGWETDGYHIMLDEKQYKYVNGKFYEVSIDEDNKEVLSKKAADLSDYFTVSEVADNTYKYVFKEKDFDILYGLFFCTEWNEETKQYERKDWRDRGYFVRNSMKGKLAVLDWIDGWDGAWEEGGILNPEALYAGSNEWGPATFHTDIGLWLADGEYNLVLGVVTDDFGEKADALTDAADVKMSKYDASKKKWVDVTEAARLTYIGKADSENVVPKGLWSFVPYTAGKFRLEAKANDKTLYLEFDITLPHVGMYSSNTTLNESTIVLHDLYNQIDAGDKSTSYYLYGYDFDAKIAGILSKVDIYDWNGEPTSYALQDGSFYEINAEGTISDVPTDLSDVFKLEKDSSKAGLFKLTPWPNDYEVAFTFIFDFGNGDIREESNSYHFNVSQKGLVINGCVTEASPGVWSSKFFEGAEYDYGKFFDLCVGDTGYFALAVNKNDAWPSEEKHDLTRLSAATGITLYKVVDGKNEAAGKSAVFKYSMNSVFEFTAYEAGEYRLVYTDGTYVTFMVNEPGAAFYRGEVTGDDYNFNDANLLKDGDISLTAEEAVTGELVFYAVVDGRAIDDGCTPVVFIDQDTWSEADDDFNHTTLYYSAHPEWVSTDGGFSVEAITGKNIFINGREANGSLVYKITVNRDEYYGLSEREFYLMFKNANDDDMDAITENGEAIFGMDGWENASFRLTPADISKAEVIAFAGLPTEMRLTEDESIVQVENLEENLQIKFGEFVLTNPSQYNIIYTTQRTYPGTAKFLVEGIRDFAGTVEGSFEIGKLNIANIAFFDGEIYYDSVTKSVVAEACSYYGIINPPAERFGSLVKNGVDYEITLVEEITKDSPSGRYEIKVSALEGSKYLTGEKTVEAVYDKESNFSMEVDYGRYTNPERYTYIYDGTEKVPTPEIWGCGGILEEGVDYDIVKPTGGAINANTDYYEDNYKFTAVGKGWFAGQTVDVVVHISPADIAAAKVTGLPKSITSGDEIPAVVLTWNGKELVKDTDYTVTMDNVTVGTGTLSIEGIGNFTGNIVKSVTVKADTTITSKNARISPKDSDKKYVYPEAPQATDFVVEMKDASGTFAPMAEGTYAITVTQADKAGNAVITATGNAETGYAGTVTAKVAIDRRELNKDEIIFTPEEVTYSPDGNYFDFAEITRSIEDADFTYGVDFTAKYSANKAGTQTVTFTGIGNYTGEVSYEFTVNKLDISTVPDCWIRNTKGNTTTFYTQKVGDKIDFSTKDVILTYCGEVDFPATDYEVKCDATEFVSTGAGVNAKYTFEIKGIGDNCVGTYEYVINVAVTPEKTDISDFKVVLVSENPEADTFVFTGNNLLYEDSVQVYDKDGNPLDWSTDYTVSLTDAVNAGKQKATIVGIGNYKGIITKTYTIKPVKVTDETAGISIFGNKHDFYINENGKVDFGEITDILYNDTTLPRDSYTYSFKAPKVARGELVELTVNYKGNLTGKVTYKGDTLCNVMECKPDIIGIDVKDCTYEITGTDTYTYTGKAITPKLTVKVGGKKLTVGKDYTFKFFSLKKVDYVDSMTEVGEYYPDIYGCGKYDGYIEVGFKVTVKPASIAQAKVTLARSSYDFVKDISGNEEGFGEVKEVKLGKTKLVEGTDYTVSFKDNMKPGTATAVITGKGNYGGSVTKTFTINGKVDINDAAVRVNVAPEAFYSGSKTGAVPEVNVYYNEKELEQGKDYMLVLANNKKVSGEGEKATVTIKGTGKYTGTYDTVYPFTVIKRFVEERDPDVVLANAKTIHESTNGHDTPYNVAGTTYNGKAQSVDPKVKIGGSALKLGTDYEVHYLSSDSYTDPSNVYIDWSLYPTSVVNAGDYYAVITFKGNYEGTILMHYIVAPINIAKASIKTNLVTFDGHDPSNIVKSAKVGKTTLTEHEDFRVNYKGCPNKNDYNTPYFAFRDTVLIDRNELKTVLKLDMPHTYEDNSQADLDCYGAGNHTAYVVGTGNYTGYKKVTWSYTGADIKNLKVTVSDDPKYYYYMDADTPYVEAGYTDAQGLYHELSSYNEFSVTYSWGSYENGDYPKAGKHTLTVTSPYFKGSKKFTYTVLPRDFDENSLARDAITINVNDAQYNPKGAKPAVTIDNEWDYAPLVAGKDYTVTYKDNKKAGTATAVVKFKGNYKGTIEKTFEIDRVRIKECKASFKTGKTWKPTITLKDPSGSKLKENTDYTVEYTYKQDTYVKNGKNTILRYAGDTVDPKDVLPLGTEIKGLVEGIGNYRSDVTIKYIYNGKNSIFSHYELQ